MTDETDARETPEDAIGCWSELIDSVRDVVVVISSRDGRVLAANGAAEAIYGADHVANGVNVDEILAPDARATSPLGLEHRERIPECGALFEDVHVGVDGEAFPVEVNASVVELRGKPAIVAVVRDITSRKRTEDALTAAYSEIEQVFDTAADGMRIIDRGFNVVRVNRTLAEMAGIRVDDQLAMKCFEAFPGEACKTPDCSLVRVLRGEGKFTDEIVKRQPQGPAITCAVTAQPFILDGKVMGVIEDFHDVSERKQREDEAQYLATHDALTGLPNRLLFMDRLGRSIAMAERGATTPALMFCDVDRFKALNDTLGHALGDRVLVSAAHALRDAVRESDTVARLGGDEFVVLLPDVDSEGGAKTVAQKILRCVTRLERHGEATLGLTLSIGMTVYAKGDDTDSMMSRADEAMYRVKDHGGNGCASIGA